MAKARLLSSLNIFVLYIAAAGAFSPAAKSKSGRVSSLDLHSDRRSENVGDRGQGMPRRSDFLAALGTFVTGSVMASVVEPAGATVGPDSSSSFYLSEEIKTFDLSLPTYDSINSLKADEKALGVEGAPEPTAKGKKQPKQKREPPGSSGNGNPMASVLPSMNKSGPSKKPKPAKKSKEKAEQVDQAPPKLEYETMDMGLPSYSDNTGTKTKSVFSL
mmetsp:Transcript_28840/g.61879  ORF Transcript_28840/g.61879 Transcript_28840/m.61879 type:complete len:217 (+) Transcript_28840:221-871(+)|eukprot:CAMPEP_0201119496 /NCGR_PEP_ID=MMETSP0850-20130426/3630_1 /ASSEMBLY_ACC=CAM_ASM_000622 /TAXON_ID=183588 /ORGANISM="Pseudo-nitzschia fraudulenta, Strain WWA7" /LENGTH=216 /DNA_ID=CAMNT_0047385225 /DNA_START=212 /DNA_END=862 /DNA_ORIENTATION=-